MVLVVQHESMLLYFFQFQYHMMLKDKYNSVYIYAHGYLNIHETCDTIAMYILPGPRL